MNIRFFICLFIGHMTCKQIKYIFSKHFILFSFSFLFCFLFFYLKKNKCNELMNSFLLTPVWETLPEE